MIKVTDEMMVKLTMEGVVVYTRLGTFLEENDFTMSEIGKIRDRLSEGRPYYSGGGAQPHWKLEADK
jgi:hypothetical protein